MYQNRVNVLKNRLYVCFKGRMEVDEIKSACADAVAKAKTLKPGFGTISEISEFVPTTEDGRLIMQETMKTLKVDYKMGQVVRVVSEKAQVAGNQWQRTSRAAASYTAEQASTVEEAEKILDQAEKK